MFNGHLTYYVRGKKTCNKTYTTYDDLVFAVNEYFYFCSKFRKLICEFKDVTYHSSKLKNASLQLFVDMIELGWVRERMEILGT